MSVEALIWAKRQLPRLPKRHMSARLLLLILADEVRDEAHGGDGRTCWPGRETLAGLMGCKPATVSEALRVLEEAELIKRYPRMRPNGRGRKSDLIELFGPAFCGPQSVEPTVGSAADHSPLNDDHSPFNGDHGPLNGPEPTRRRPGETTEERRRTRSRARTTNIGITDHGPLREPVPIGHALSGAGFSATGVAR